MNNGIIAISGGEFEKPGVCSVGEDPEELRQITGGGTKPKRAEMEDMQKSVVQPKPSLSRQQFDDGAPKAQQVQDPPKPLQRGGWGGTPRGATGQGDAGAGIPDDYKSKR